LANCQANSSSTSTSNASPEGRQKQLSRRLAFLFAASVLCRRTRNVACKEQNGAEHYDLLVGLTRKLLQLTKLAKWKGVGEGGLGALFGGSRNRLFPQPQMHSLADSRAAFSPASSATATKSKTTTEMSKMIMGHAACIMMALQWEYSGWKLEIQG